MPQLEYATPVWNSLSKSRIQTLERIYVSNKFMFGNEYPITYPDRPDRRDGASFITQTRHFRQVSVIQKYSRSLLIACRQYTF